MRRVKHGSSAGLARAASVGSTRAPLGREAPKNFDLSEENCLLEAGCRWQSLNCAEHLELLSARGEDGWPFAVPLHREMRRLAAKQDIEGSPYRWLRCASSRRSMCSCANRSACSRLAAVDTPGTGVGIGGSFPFPRVKTVGPLSGPRDTARCVGHGKMRTGIRGSGSHPSSEPAV